MKKLKIWQIALISYVTMFVILFSITYYIFINAEVPEIDELRTSFIISVFVSLSSFMIPYKIYENRRNEKFISLYNHIIDKLEKMDSKEDIKTLKNDYNKLLKYINKPWMVSKVKIIDNKILEIVEKLNKHEISFIKKVIIFYETNNGFENGEEKLMTSIIDKLNK